jgi:hypothetical protein
VIPDEAVEAAARAMAPAVWGPSVWQFAAHGETPTAARDRVQKQALQDARRALEAAAPHLMAEATSLIRDLTDPEECSFDHHGGCQAHGFLSLQPGETCPQHDAKAWVARAEP